MAVRRFLSVRIDVGFLSGGSESCRNSGERDHRSTGGSEGKHMKVSMERLRLVQVGER